MGQIKFGWALSVGPGKGMSQQQYTEEVQRSIELIDGHCDSLWFVDHLQFGNTPVLEGWTALTYLAAQYPQFKVGHMVLCQSFRNPALLAKMTSTLQYMSGGRFLLGIGAGWHEEEYRAYNYDFPSARARLEQLEETIQILKAMWSDEQATVQGKHYAVQAAYNEPKPEPTPPIIIGGQGTRMLRVVARYADDWNAAWVGVEEYKQKVAELELACREVGRDPATLRRSWFGRCVCVATQAEAENLGGMGLVGTPEQIAEQMRAYVALGVDSFMIGSRTFPDKTTVELLMSEVLPRVRG